jgi:hypothetical protein
MRLCAQSLFNDAEKRGTFTPREKAYYTSAVEHYQKSLGALGERKSFPEVWDRVTWELSGTYYTVGTLVQDYVSLKEYEEETVSCFNVSSSELSCSTGTMSMILITSFELLVVSM